MTNEPLLNKPKHNTAILFATHQINRSIIKTFEDLYDSCHKDFSVILSCYRDVLEKNKSVWQKYPCHIRDVKLVEDRGCLLAGDAESLGGQAQPTRDGVWLNPELFLIDYYLNNPAHDYYWLIEYDVRFSGNWNVFFNSFVHNPADLLCTKIMRGDKDAFYYWWDKTNLNLERSQQLSVFFPVIRLSNKALAYLNEQYTKGARGFCEVLVPTLLDQNGFSIQSVGEEWYKWYETFYSPYYFAKQRNHRWPISPRKKLPPTNQLYHPVKDVTWRERIFLYLVDMAQLSRTRKTEQLMMRVKEILLHK